MMPELTLIVFSGKMVHSHSLTHKSVGPKLANLAKQFFKINKFYQGKLSIRKSNETWEFVPSGDDPPLAGLGLFWTWDFIEMGWSPP